MDENLIQTEGGQQEQVATPATPPVVEEQPINKPERTYTKAEIQNLMRRRVERSHNAFFKRYGVQNLKGLDELMNKSKSIGDEYANLQLKNSDLSRENAFLRNNINPEKYNDIITHFKGSGIDFSEEALLEALKTHPEWLKVQPQTTTIQKLGQEFHKQEAPDEKIEAGRLLGVKL